MEQIPELKIIDENGDTVFTHENYIIPLYQRAFAWTDKEICQLIDDICDYEADYYYLGSLIVADENHDGVYEVIDGQQRLTTLFLLLNYLGYRWGANHLRYECREKSDYTLNNLTDLLDKEKIETRIINAEKVEQTILSGAECVVNKFASMAQSETVQAVRDKFVEKLKHVRLYRIMVPEHTDLNRYFEIMNVRGEQLEQHDILKAKLMEKLPAEKQGTFAVIWDACRDMTGYVQMHFSVRDREILFDNEWGKPNNDFWYAKNIKLGNGDANNTNATIKDITSLKKPLALDDGTDDDGNRIRFESIIEFPFFLLHVLKVFVKNECLAEKIVVPELLDDKKLLQTFTDVQKQICAHNFLMGYAEFSEKFMQYLLKCRFLFDKYIIKREYKNENEDGDWSLKELKVSGARSKKRPYYVDTNFGEAYERESTYRGRTHIDLMLQSCLRVSYTSPKIMHWITILLQWLYKDENLKNLSTYESVIEKVAQKSVAEFLREKNYKMGVATPHIVLNYLDYLLWKNRTTYFDFMQKDIVEISDFRFEFRNSVEHWYPQHPSENSFDEWKDGVDYFGNLCIIQRNINAKFSNLSPTAKKTTYAPLIKKGSLKLRLMSALTKNDDKWREEICGEHGKLMLDLLRIACEKDNVSSEQ